MAEALQEANVSLPEYFSIAVELEGEPIPLLPPRSDIGVGKPPGEVLSEEQFQMSQRAGTTIYDGAAGQAEKKARYFCQLPDKPGRQ